jgi:O-antigen/teichoic acid export membrane protein
VDLWVVRYFLGDKISGLYFAASMISRIPYFLVLGVTATVLPTVSWQLATDAMDKARSTIESSLRFLLLVASPIGILLTMYGHETVHLLYSSEFLSAGSILTVLIWGVIFLSFMLLLMTIMIADHRPEMAFGVTVLAVLIDIVLNILLVPRCGAVGGAMSTTIAAGFGSITAMIFVFCRFRVIVNITSLLRIGFAAVLLWLGVEIVGVQGNTFIWVSIAGLLLYFFLLFIFREVTWQDLLNLLPGRDDEDTIPSPHSDSIPM